MARLEGHIMAFRDSRPSRRSLSHDGATVRVRHRAYRDSDRTVISDVPWLGGRATAAAGCAGPFKFSDS
jgi:hypothetical protein